MSDDPEEVAVRLPLRTAAHIGCFNAESPHYFWFVEDKAVLSVCVVSKAIMVWFIMQYIFNLKYCAHVKLVSLFFLLVYLPLLT